MRSKLYHFHSIPMEHSHNSKPHILIFPFPASGHTKPLYCLAQLLCMAGLKVTLLDTDHNYRRFSSLRARLAAQFPSLHFESIPDGLTPDQPREILDRKYRDAIDEVLPPLFRELLISYNGGGSRGSSSSPRSPVSCVITDVIMQFPVEVGEELGIPVYSFSTFSARFLLLVFSIPKLLEDGQLPHPDGNTDQELNGIPGAEGLLKCKDLPGLWSVENMIKNESMKFVNKTIASSRASGLIINTFNELEAPFLTKLSKIYKKIYTIGPIHSLLKNTPGGIWKEDHNCLAWLDSHPPRSVLFVSFGTLVKITSLQLIEFWNGLINSGKPFLLALRSDVVKDDEKMKVVNEILETKSKGKWLVVSWAPQEEVLEHEAICGFLTHSGWNSTLESIAAGVPMLTWPQISDQLSNATWVHKVWQIGFAMEDEFDRSAAETMVRSMIEHKNERVKNRIAKLAEHVKNVVAKDGIANQNLKALVEDIKKIQLN